MFATHLLEMLGESKDTPGQVGDCHDVRAD
jgi:hypothetical protein